MATSQTFGFIEAIIAIAHAIASAGAMTKTIGGTVVFRIASEPSKTWIVDLDQAGGAWSTCDANANDAREPDVEIEGTADAFPSLLLEPDAVPRLVKDGKLIARGDLDKLTLLAN